ncbi:MAG: dTDP-4-dehydrorhamnose 3,5-epimerase [Deltaproteobacteria bacterium]|nr:dTDP-4-dehydrorhamnose 3,5-epimerase [Deltaproteobacteria bacterium]
MRVIETALLDVKILVPKKWGDHRGFFSETYNKRDFLKIGIPFDFVQDDHSLSSERGMVRGLHFQIPPHAQDKLIRVTRGAIFDVVVDIRRGSPTFGKHVTTTLSAKEWQQISIPRGFAHGFCTLEPGTEVLYKVSNFYEPDAERGLLWNDPELGIAWPISENDVTLSERDKKFPTLAQLEAFF